MIFIDTWIWIEFLAKGAKTEEAKSVIESQARKAISTAVLAELRYHSIKKFGMEETESIMYLIESNESILVVPLTKEIAKTAADIRLKYYDKKVRDMSFIDAINLATGIFTNCSKFYTGDKDFDGVTEIEIINIRKTKKAE
ncbi:MAG: hypothetical protein QT00_C0001G0228 [archaeon GW2011_AR5]|nr:MAG: hypothetical protein QT00_C0001G0228 [archaeon GW2011_AR5]MBS3051495.1 PIN domain-containing protein [Candidatus Aenigmarchaeota archaeon]